MYSERTEVVETPLGTTATTVVGTADDSNNTMIFGIIVILITVWLWS